jgi:ABC-type amino acid transport substrate-binding protein
MEQRAFETYARGGSGLAGLAALATTASHTPVAAQATVDATPNRMRVLPAARSSSASEPSSCIDAKRDLVCFAIDVAKLVATCLLDQRFKGCLRCDHGGYLVG